MQKISFKIIYNNICYFVKLPTLVCPLGADLAKIVSEAPLKEGIKGSPQIKYYKISNKISNKTRTKIIAEYIRRHIIRIAKTIM
jgi:hypothetical protein